VNGAIDAVRFEDTDQLVAYLRLCSSEGFTWFRGECRPDWKLRPQICRSPDYNDLALLKSFWQRSASFADAPRADDLAHWISLAQHYGLPTRVLDWTESYLVALYFATRPPTTRNPDAPTHLDFCVWILNPVKLNQSFMGEVLTTSTGASTEVGVCAETDEAILGHMMRAFGYKFDMGERFPYVAYSPQFRYLRMANQKAAFTWHQDSMPLEDTTGASGFLRKISYPASLRSSLAADLTVLGVTHSSLFPDFDGVASELKARCVGSPPYAL
jgi:FRG domain